MFELILRHLLTVLGFGLGLLLVLRILRQQNRPAVSIAWLMAILLIPYIGVPAYLLFGGRKFARLASRKKDLPRPEAKTLQSSIKCSTENVLVTSGMPPARAPNQIALVTDGQQAYSALGSLIEGAQRSVHVTTFILGRDEVGRAIIELLTRKAADGVEVRLLLDALGCLWSSRGLVAPLRRAGGKVGTFMPMLPLRRKWSAHLRNHRKMLIVDGQAAMIGGMNLAKEYLGPDPSTVRWIDSTTFVQGPAVRDLEEIFASDWDFAVGETLGEALLPEEHLQLESDEGVAQIVASGPDVPGDPLYEAILSASYEATERIWIVTPYFIPDDSLLRVLTLQSRLGRDVRIVLPVRSNHLLADLARGRFLRQMKAAGGRIFVHEGPMIHAKHLVFDRKIATAGSVNFDMRSLYLNYEAAMFMYSPREVDQTAQWISRLMAQSRELGQTEVGFFRQWAEDLGLLIAPLL